MTYRLGRLLLLAGTGAALSCGRPAPRAIAYGDELCAHCHMVVADPRFAGQLVTARGLVYTFDDIECLASFVAAGELPASRIHSLWVNDFNRPGIRLNAVEARYWRNERLRTPMSSGLVALSPGSESDSVAGSTRVTLESWEDVVTRVHRSGMHRGHQPHRWVGGGAPRPTW